MSEDPLATFQRRLHSQRLASGHFERPAEVVQWLGAMQAQEYAEAKWSIGERVDGCTDAEVEEAFARGEILRTHLLRPTWHFVTPADIRWMLLLTAPRVHAANRYSYRKYELDGDTLGRAHEVVGAALADEEPRTRPELAEALARAGIEAEGLRLGYILMHAELEEQVCSGPRRAKQHTYARFADRVPQTPQLTREEALAELSLRFFSSRGPASDRDFSAWSGLTVADAKAGRQMVVGRLDGEVGEGAAAPGAYLLPMYDEMGISYKDLRMVLAQPPPREGMLSRPIVIDGLTVGSWKRTVTGRAAVIEATLFVELTAAQRSALESVVERFGRFMELPATLEIA